MLRYSLPILSPTNLTPVYEAIREHHLQPEYFQADETRSRVFTENEGKIGHNWWLWLFACEDSVVLFLDPGRSHDVPQTHFGKHARGTLMVDRYSGYKAMDQVKQVVLALAFCWAHVRRDFVRVGKGYPELTPWGLQWLDQIRKLYHLNRQRLTYASASQEFASADRLLRNHLQSMSEASNRELANEKLQEPCGKALSSLRGHWSELTLFIDDARIPLDNNASERKIRNPAVGRKNYYGSGSEWSGRLAMMLFSIFTTLGLWKINPLSWLTWYFQACAAAGGKAAPDPASFLPWNLSKDRLAALQLFSPSQSQPKTT